MKFIRRIRMVSGIFLCFGLAGAATGQPLHQVAFEWDISQPALKQAVDTCVAATPTHIVVASNQQIVLMTTSGVIKDSKKWDETGYPFQDVAFDPRVDYDRYSGRLWMVILGSGGKIHVAISKDSSPETLGSADWHIYTGSNAFDLSLMGTGPYQGGADHPVISFDPEYMWLTSLDFFSTGSPPVRQGIALFPRTHTGGSILEGQKPPYSALAGISPGALPPPNTDDSLYHYAVQELFESVAAGQFFIATPKIPTGFAVGVQDGIRLGGAYHDSFGDLQYAWKDMTVPTAADEYYNAGILYSTSPDVWYRPATPDQDWEITTASSKFDSGALARDVNGDLTDLLRAQRAARLAGRRSG